MSRRKTVNLESRKIVNRRAKLAINRSLATARHLNKPNFVKKPSTGIWNHLEASESDEETNQTKDAIQASDNVLPSSETSKKSAKKKRIKKRKFIFTTKSGKPYKRPKIEIKTELDDSIPIRKPDRQPAKPRKGYFDRKDVENHDDGQQDYSCEFCATTFSCYVQFKSHNVNCALSNPRQTSSHSPTEIVYKCTSCNNIYELFFDYLKHFVDNGGLCVDQAKTRLAAWDACVCVMCGFTTRRSTMMDHLRQEHLKELRNIGEEFYQHCRLCASQREISTSKTGKFMSALEFFNHLSSWHPRAILLIKSDEEEVDSDGLTPINVNCRLCGLIIPKCELKEHISSEHCELDSDHFSPERRKLLYDPSLLGRRRPESPPVPFVSACEDVDRETMLKYRRKRHYRWTQYKDKRQCTSCGWLGANRNEFLIHLLCQLCKPQYNETDRRMKCSLCVAVVERTEILTHLCEMHDSDTNIKLPSETLDENYTNEGVLAREIIGHDWICPQCQIGFDRDRKQVNVGHRCCRPNKLDESFVSSSSMIRVCPLCRARLRNDVLLSLHHRFEHEEARSGLEDPCDDPNFVYSVLETQAESVSAFMKRVTLNLTSKEVERSISDGGISDPRTFKCNSCKALFHTDEVCHQHKNIFHSQSASSYSSRFNELFYQLNHCQTLNIPFTWPSSFTSTVQLPSVSTSVANGSRLIAKPEVSPSKQRRLLPKTSANVPSLVLRRPDPVVHVSVGHGPIPIVQQPINKSVLHYIPQPAIYPDVPSPTAQRFPSMQRFPFQKKKVAPPVVVNTFSLSNPDDKHHHSYPVQLPRMANKLMKPNKIIDPVRPGTVFIRAPQGAIRMNSQPNQSGHPVTIQVKNPSPVKQTVLVNGSSIVGSNINFPRLVSFMNPNSTSSTQSNNLPLTSNKQVHTTFASTPHSVMKVVSNRDVLGEMLHRQRNVIRVSTTKNGSFVPSVQIIRPRQSIMTSQNITNVTNSLTLKTSFEKYNAPNQPN